MKPDLITSQPPNCDYPKWRHYLSQIRNQFNHVFVTIHLLSRYNNIKPIVAAYAPLDVEVFSARIQECRDWRDVIVNMALQRSDSDIVLFMEQDFIIKNNDIISKSISEVADSVICFFDGYRQPTTSIPSKTQRMHPAFIMIERKNIDKTTRYFGVGTGYDHFGQIQMDIEHLGIQIKNLESLGFQTPIDWEHLAGLTHDYSLTMENHDYIRSLKENQCARVLRFIEYNKEIVENNYQVASGFAPLFKKAASI